MESESCFVCGCALGSKVNHEIKWRTKKTGGAALLENNLNVIFLLRNLLQVPSIQLECQLRESGDNPETWLSFCDQCTQLIGEARELDGEIQKIRERLRLIQEDIVGKISDGNSRTSDDKAEHSGEAYLENFEGDDFENKIRCYAKNYQFNQLAEEKDGLGFLEGDDGDKLANYLESQGNDCTATIVLVEKSGEDEPDEIKVEPEPVESPPTPEYSPLQPIAEDSPILDFVDDEVNVRQDKQKEGITNETCSVCGRKFNGLNALSRHMKGIHGQRFSIPCPLCPEGMGFQAKRYLHRHLFRKHKDEPITKKLEQETGLFFRKCLVVGCVAHFMKQVDQDRHMANVHGGGGGGGDQSKEKSFKCKYCGMGFWNRSKCRRHEKIHEEKGKVKENRWNTSRKGLNIKVNCNFKCDICGKGFKWARNWSDHLWNKHDQREISCPGLECGKIFQDELVEFRNHWKTSHVTQVIKKRRIIGGKREKNQDLTKPGEKFVCSFCGKEFGRQSYLQIHRKNQHLSKPGEKFVCEICGVEKKSKDNLYQHKRDVHLKSKGLEKAVVEKHFICGICGNGFALEKGLLLHKRNIHRLGRNDQPVKPKRKRGEGEAMLGELKALCNICGKEFSSESNLKNHVKFVHEKQLGFSCHVCGLKFSYKSQFHLHLLRNHKEDPVTRQLEEEEGIKIIKCPVIGCSGRFLKQDTLDKHVKNIHKGGGGGDVEKRFQCKYCGKGFWTGPKVKRHERIHEGEGREDWKCEICGKGFSTPEYLDYHLRLTHKQAKKFQKSSTDLLNVLQK